MITVSGVQKGMYWLYLVRLDSQTVDTIWLRKQGDQFSITELMTISRGYADALGVRSSI